MFKKQLQKINLICLTIIILVVIALFQAEFNNSKAQACINDTDCPDGQSCVDGACEGGPKRTLRFATKSFSRKKCTPNGPKNGGCSDCSTCSSLLKVCVVNPDPVECAPLQDSADGNGIQVQGTTPAESGLTCDVNDCKLYCGSTLASECGFDCKECKDGTCSYKDPSFNCSRKDPCFGSFNDPPLSKCVGCKCQCQGTSSNNAYCQDQNDGKTPNCCNSVCKECCVNSDCLSSIGSTNCVNGECLSSPPPLTPIPIP